MLKTKVPFNDLLKELEQIIYKKINTPNEQWIDKEILAFISVYRHGANKYKNHAKQWLTTFLINASFVKRGQIEYEEVKE